jgi:hypothetical protein
MRVGKGSDSQGESVRAGSALKKGAGVARLSPASPPLSPIDRRATTVEVEVEVEEETEGEGVEDPSYLQDRDLGSSPEHGYLSFDEDDEADNNSNSKRNAVAVKNAIKNKAKEKEKSQVVRVNFAASDTSTDNSSGCIQGGSSRGGSKRRLGTPARKTSAGRMNRFASNILSRYIAPLLMLISLLTSSILILLLMNI